MKTSSSKYVSDLSPVLKSEISNQNSPLSRNDLSANE